MRQSSVMQVCSMFMCSLKKENSFGFRGTYNKSSGRYLGHRIWNTDNRHTEFHFVSFIFYNGPGKAYKTLWLQNLVQYNNEVTFITDIHYLLPCRKFVYADSFLFAKKKTVGQGFVSFDVQFYDKMPIKTLQTSYRIYEQLFNVLY